jgi:outer membrane autotransporter protein
LDTNTLTINGSTVNLNGSEISIGKSGSTSGSITASTNFNANIGTVTINLENLANNNDWLGVVLVDAKSGTVTANVDNITLNTAASFLKLEATTSQLKISQSKITFEDMFDSAGASPTPNIEAGLNLLEKVRDDAKTPAQVIKQLEDAFVKITDTLQNDSPKLAQSAMKQLIGEPLVNVNTSVSSTVLKTQGVVFNRLDRVREIEINNLTPPAAGSASAGSGNELNRIWVGGFGIWAKEENSSTVDGYDFSGGGVSLGYDRKIAPVPGLRVGVSGAFFNGRIKNNDRRTTVDLSTVGFGVYGSYILPNNVFFDANVGYANTKNDYSSNQILGGVKSGSFQINSWQFGVRGGYVYKGDNFQIIPSLGLKYVFLRQGSFADTLDAAAQGITAANAYRARNDSQFDIPLQVKLNTTFESGSAIITPELRLGYNFAVQKLDNAMEVGFVGSNETVKIVGTRSRGNSFQAGVGVKVNSGGIVDGFLNYDIDASHSYFSSNASIGVGFEF